METTTPSTDGAARPTSLPDLAALRRLPLPIDAADYDIDDAAGTVGGAPHRWRWIVEGLDDVPGPALVALEAMADVLGAAGGEGRDLTALAGSVERRLRELSAEHGARTKLVDALGEHHPLLIATEEVDRLLSAAGRAVAAHVGVPGTGELAQVGVSGGGPPKATVGSAEIGPRGLVGDRQATRRHHGRPFQAVSIFSAEVIRSFADEGHPIAPGAVGENLTVAVLDWTSLRPGIRLAVGHVDPVVLELTSWAPPCKKVAGAFSDLRFDHLDHDLHPGRGRAYAWVVHPGRVTAGDPVHVLP